MEHLSIEDSSWSKSLFKRMGYVRRLATTGKVEISEKLKAEIETAYLYGIVQKINEHKIPSSMVINLDQIPSKFVPGCNKTLAKKGCKSVPIAGSTDKRIITATFSITLTGEFLPIQLIYGAKTTKSIPAVSFPSDFVISVNKKHRNENGALNMLENIIIPYVEQQRVSLNLAFDHPALIIMDVFKFQMTCAVRELLNENHILLEKVPANLTYLFQPLDVQGGPNGYVKRFMKKKFTLWYSDQVIRALDEGKDIKDVEISLKLSIVKLPHAKWLIEMYNHMTSSEGRDVCLKGRKVAGILDATEKGLEELPNLDPFHDIDPLATSDSLEDVDGNESETERSMYISPSFDKDDEDSEYEDEDENIFDVFDEKSDDE